MNDIVKLVQIEFEKLHNINTGGHITTGDIRKLSAKLYRMDMFPSTDRSKDINPVLSSHIETVVGLYRR